MSGEGYRNVTAGTTGSSRLAEIRARLSVAQHYRPHNCGDLDGQLRQRMQEDTAWLLDEVERQKAIIRRSALEDLIRMSEDLPGGYLGGTDD